jgi:hypothetical protein
MAKRNSKPETPADGTVVTVVYMGRVLSIRNTLLYKYMALDGPNKGEELCFKRSLLGSESIGTVLNGQRTPTGMKGPYSFVGRHKSGKDIAEWSKAEAAAVAEKDLLQAAKTKHPEHIDTFIDGIKRGFTGHQRRMIALYIFNKLSSYA